VYNRSSRKNMANILSVSDLRNIFRRFAKAERMLKGEK
jgi:hypothetical protein